MKTSRILLYIVLVATALSYAAESFAKPGSAKLRPPGFFKNVGERTLGGRGSAEPPKATVFFASPVAGTTVRVHAAEEAHHDHAHADHDEHAHEDHGDHADHEGHADHAEHGHAHGEAATRDAHADHDDHEGHDHHEAQAGHDDHAGHGHEDHDDHGHAEEDDHTGHGHEDHDDHGHEEGVIKLDPQTLREFSIPIETAKPGMLERLTNLPGEVQVNEDRQAHIVPRYAGLVVEVKKHMGDHVEKGDVLAVLESNESLATYELKSLISGTLIEKHITLGESLKDDDIAFVVADLETVWIDLAIYQKDMALIRPGQKVVIQGGEHLPTTEGTISYVSPTVDVRTRTGHARIVLPNKEGTWKPGLFVTANVILGRVKAGVVVPRDAVIGIDGQPSVFVQTKKGLEPRTVRLGMNDGQRVEILEGLAAGEAFATRNVLPLKAELNRAALEHAGHAH